MLTIENLKSNSLLSGLTDEQFAAIATMSEADEQTVMDTRIGQLHGQYEADVLAVTGIQKNSGEKAYAYAKRVLGALKENADKAVNLTEQLNTAKSDLAKAQKALEEGSQDATLRQQLKDAQKQVTGLQEQLANTQREAAAQKAQLKNEYDNARINMAIDAAMSGYKFKDGITEPLQKALIAQAKSEVLSRGKAEIDDKGTVIFRNADGTVLTNNKNAFNPYTISELLAESSIKDALQLTSGGGGGTREPAHGGATITSVSIAGARTQVEADEMIAKALMTQGLTADSNEYHEKFAEIRKAQNVSALPLT